MNRWLPGLFAGVILLLLAITAVGQTSYPMVAQAHPVAVQRGQSAEVVVTAMQNLPAVTSVLVEGEGLTAALVPAAKGQAATQVRLKFKAEENAPLGVREFRLVTAAGVSSVGQISLVAEPVLASPPTNLTREKAAAVKVPAVVCGRIAAVEQSNWYKLEVQTGQSLTFEVLGARIQDKIHDLQRHLDPLLSLHDEQGRELAACDDRLFADPLLTYTFKKSGICYVQVRDAKYDGVPHWVYALRITPRPPVLATLPWAIQPGSSQMVKLIGPAGEMGEAIARLERDASVIGWQQVELVHQGQVDSVPIFVSAEAKETAKGEELPKLELPQVVSGIVEKGKPVIYRFTAKRGQAVQFTVHARRFGTSLYSPLDAVLEVRSAQGRVSQRADDDGPQRRDAVLTFNPPDSGEYQLVLSDLHGRGGPNFTYVLECRPTEPDFEVKVDGDKATLAGGTFSAWFVQVNRKGGFTGPITIWADELPVCVSAQPLVIPADLTQGLLLLKADGDAVPEAKAVKVWGEATINGKEVRRPASHWQEIYLPGGGRGRFESNLPAVAVVEKTDLVAIEVEPKTINLKPNGEATLKVKLKRRPEAEKANVTLDLRLRHLNQSFADPLPPGVAIIEGRSKLNLGTENEGIIVLRAAPNASAIKDWTVAVQAFVSINFVVKIGHSSGPISLTVERAAP